MYEPLFFESPEYIIGPGVTRTCTNLWTLLGLRSCQLPWRCRWRLDKTRRVIYTWIADTAIFVLTQANWQLWGIYYFPTWSTPHRQCHTLHSSCWGTLAHVFIPTWSTQECSAYVSMLWGYHSPIRLGTCHDYRDQTTTSQTLLHKLDNGKSIKMWGCTPTPLHFNDI